MAAAAAAGQLILTKNDIRRDRLAYRAFVDGGAKVFFLPNRSLSAEEMSARYLENLNRIIERGLMPSRREPGHYVTADPAPVDRDLRQLKLTDSPR